MGILANEYDRTADLETMVQGDKKQDLLKLGRKLMPLSSRWSSSSGVQRLSQGITVGDVKMTMYLAPKMVAKAKARRVTRFATPGETLGDATDRIALTVTPKTKVAVKERKAASLEQQTS